VIYSGRDRNEINHSDFQQLIDAVSACTNLKNLNISCRFSLLNVAMIDKSQ